MEEPLHRLRDPDLKYQHSLIRQDVTAQWQKQVPSEADLPQVIHAINEPAIVYRNQQCFVMAAGNAENDARFIQDFPASLEFLLDKKRPVELAQLEQEKAQN